MKKINKIRTVPFYHEYIPRDDRNLMKNIIVTLKHFIGRAGITEKELNIIQGLCTQIEKKVVKR